MSKKKNKFDLTHLVHQGALSANQVLHFVSDPKKTCTIVKHPSGEYKVQFNDEMMTLHAVAQKCLGQDPPDHASKWFRTSDGKILYDLWHMNDKDSLAA